MNFRQLDLNLLRVLAAIHRTGSVTAAGKALALSQPATSNALARLRDYFQDDLFVRSPGGLQATRLCERLAPEVLRSFSHAPRRGAISFWEDRQYGAQWLRFASRQPLTGAPS